MFVVGRSSAFDRLRNDELSSKDAMDVLMPQLGETVAEGKITKWFKSAGDAVKPGDNLFEIETDKVSMEVPSTTAGVLSEIRVGAGEVAPVGAVRRGDRGGGGCGRSRARREPRRRQGRACCGSRSTANRRCNSAWPAWHPSRRHAQPAAHRPLRRSRSIRSSRCARPSAITVRRSSPAAPSSTPLARRLAAEPGSISRRSGLRPARPHRRARCAGASRRPGAAMRGAALVPGRRAGRSRRSIAIAPFEEVPLDGMRTTIATRLVQAKQTIPHFYLTADVEIGRLLALREEVNAAAPKDKDGSSRFKLSVNDLIIKAWAVALQRVPAANAVWAEDRILRFRHSDIGVAVAIEGGLITPVIRHAETKTLSAISAEMRELAARAREKKLKPNEYQGGSSAISNLGMYGVREFAAIINPPQATILAVGAARRQAVETKDGGVAFASVMTVTLSCDHRVVDGALGAELLAAFRGL